MLVLALLIQSLSLLAYGSECDTSSRRLAITESHPIVLDDLEATGVLWHRGTFQPCLEDAHGSMFHHDWGRDKGNVSAIYKFNPSQDGCYVIEEYHPGSNPLCSAYLPRNARVDVDYCRGKTAYTYVDQSHGGGQWNILGALPFYVGWEGRIKVGNAGTSGTCSLTQNCFWVADAFRLTRVSDLSNGCTVPDWMTSAEPSSDTSTVDPEDTLLTTSMGHPAASSAMSASALDLVQSSSLHQTIVVDDTGLGGVSSPWKRYVANSDALSCISRGWQMSFAYLDPNSAENAETAIDFVFDVQADGCYLVEEFHPPNVCSQSFSSNVVLSIDYCKGMSKNFQVDQTQNGNQWNTVALLPFYKGLPGKLRVSHPQVGSDLAIADAFRFTRVSETCYGAHRKATHFVHLAQNAASVVVDGRASPSTTSDSAICAKKALGGSVHVGSSGLPEARFRFTPSSTGCYRVDSYHPENNAGEGCALADSAALEVNWCLGKQTSLTTPLKGNGNQWQTIGHFKYYAGVEGSIVSRPLGSLNGKYWVADAFRFAKVSESCDAVPHVGLMTLHITSPALETFNSSNLHSGLTSYPDMRIALHEAVLEATGLAHDALKLLSLRKGSILVDAQIKGAMVDIGMAMARITSQTSSQERSSLKKALCQAVVPHTDGPCEVKVAYQKVLPAPHGTHEEALPSDGPSSGMIVVLVAFIACIFFAAALKLLFCVRRSKSSASVWVDPVMVMETPPDDLATDAEDVVKAKSIDSLTEKTKNDDEISLAGSTVTPTSLNSQVDLEIMSVASGGAPVAALTSLNSGERSVASEV